MTRVLLVVGWILVGLDVIAAASLIFGRKGGDAATSALGPGFGSLLLILGAVAAALLFWGGQGTGKPIVMVIASVLAIAPVAITLAFLAPSQRMLGWIYPSMRDDRPKLPSPKYEFPDAAGREAALALLMQNYAKLDTLLHVTPAPDLTAHNELGQSLIGIATIGASADGSSVLFHKYLRAGAARVLLAHGANPNVRDISAATADWSPVTQHADWGNWATALALLEGGVPPDHGSPVGAVLARVLKDGEYRLTDDDRADASFKAFRTLVQK